jgi:hypothetical protein
MSGTSAAENTLEPFFSAAQFQEACVALVEMFRRSETEARWTPIPLPKQLRHSGHTNGGYLLVRDTFICPSKHRKEIRVDYHVVLSNTWQVPVLYFAPVWTDTVEPLSLKEVYEFIVETSSKDAVEDVGIMGGISHGVYLPLFIVDLRTILFWGRHITLSTLVAQQTFCKTSKKTTELFHTNSSYKSGWGW